MVWHRRPVVRIVAAAIGLLALAFNPALQGLARDGKARADLQPGMHAELAASWIAQLPVGPVECTEGFAGPFPCDGVDLASLVTIPELGAGTGSDVWGWHDDETGREIAIPTTVAGAAFVDVTDPTSPQVLGRMTIGQDERDVIWRDVKVFDDHAFVVSEHDGTHLHIFDLTRLREFDSDQGLLEPDTVHESFDSAHNIAINTDTGFAYVIGGNVCDGGLHILDVNDPKNPTEAGCFDGDGYTHDVQCVIYDGPDAEHRGSEICLAANEDTLTIVDVTDKANPVQLSRTPYDTAAYTHQGWLTPDQGFFIFGDELDELGNPDAQTATYMLDVTDLDDPGAVQTFLHDSTAIDHNLYVHNDLVWEANYTAGLRVMDYTTEGLANGELTEVGSFDVFPPGDPTVFGGAWTAYPYFPSGTIVLNSFDTGMFVLTSDLNPATPPDEDDDTSDPAEDRRRDDRGQDRRDAGGDNRDDRGRRGGGGGAQVQAAAQQLPATGGGAAALALGALAAGTVLRRRA